MAGYQYVFTRPRCPHPTTRWRTSCTSRACCYINQVLSALPLAGHVSTRAILFAEHVSPPRLRGPRYRCDEATRGVVFHVRLTYCADAKEAAVVVCRPGLEERGAARG
jgi:hypothetical protein